MGLYWAWLLLTIGLAANMSAGAFPQDQSLPLIPLTLVLLAALVAAKGPGAACRFVLQPLTQRLGLPLLAWAVLGAVFTSVIYALFIWLTGCAGPGDFIVRRTRKKAGERDSSV